MFASFHQFANEREPSVLVGTLVLDATDGVGVDKYIKYVRDTCHIEKYSIRHNGWQLD